MAEMFTTFSTPDPESWLPEPAASRLKRLKQRAVDARQLLPDRGTIDALRIDKSQAEQRLARLRRSGSQGGFAIEGDSHPAVRTELRKLAAINSELSRLLELDQQRSDVWTKRGQLLSKTESWLRDGRPDGTAISVVEIEPPPLKKGQSIFDAVEAHRFRLRELRANFHRVRSAPYPLAEARAKITAQIDQLAQSGQPYVDSVIEHLNDVVFATMTQTSLVYNLPMPADGCAAIGTVPDLLGLFAWLNHDALIDALCAKAAEAADDQHALGAIERAEKEAEIMTDVLALEREEVSLIWAAEAEGLTIEFRPDVSPEAVLGIEITVAAPAISVRPWFPLSYPLTIGTKG